MTSTAPISSPKVAKSLARISERIQRANDYNSVDYERDVTSILTLLFPYSVLPGIRLFNTEPRGSIDYGYEMDNLLHIRHGGTDYIVIVEAKKQDIKPSQGKWIAKYGEKEKCVKDQVDNHIKTMWEYLQPLDGGISLRFIAIVVSTGTYTSPVQAYGFHNAELHLCSFLTLPEVLLRRFSPSAGTPQQATEVLRVAQSIFLNLLRLSLPVAELGHPELASAITYVERCRRTLDGSLFQWFDPKPERWVINGSAGMGKSVLLAYTAAVLCSGYQLYRALGEIGVTKATKTLTSIGFAIDSDRGTIAIMAMSSKQLDNLQSWYNLFVGQFQRADTEGTVRFRPPQFLLCRSQESFTLHGRRWAALLVDEAHDLPPYGATALAKLYAEGGLYVVLACDRHQKLRLAGSDARIVEGMDFSNRSTRLRQIYRNPAPVYIASLGLMFRWFAEEGPTIVPTVDELNDQFGFQARVDKSGNIELVMQSDAHPANSWSHTVAMFPDVSSVYNALIEAKMGSREVLWVRFSEEDPEFDYERITNCFTYHNCRVPDAHKISDKYIKGQDYPIVVIEGFPGFMDRYSSEGGRTKDDEAKMWAFRRELYLCASRATAFLYFVCNVPQTSEVVRIRQELRRLLAATSAPAAAGTSGTRSWRVALPRISDRRGLSEFSDLVATVDPVAIRVGNDEAAIESTTIVRGISSSKKLQEALPLSDPKHRLTVPSIPTARKLSVLFGVQPLRVVADLKQLGILVERDTPIVTSFVQILCKKYGYEAVFEEPGEGGDDYDTPLTDLFAEMERRRPMTESIQSVRTGKP